jgi:uncharacterized delta-60 repeat protein
MRARKFVWLLLVAVVAGLGFYFFRPRTESVPSARAAPPVAIAPTPPLAFITPAAAPEIAAPEPATRADKNPRPDSVIASAWLAETRPAMSAFADWTARYLNANGAQRAALLAEGQALARKRRAALADLIPVDPEQALADAVPMVVRQQLPPEILSLLEERVSAQSNLSLLAGSPPPGQSTVVANYRAAVINGREYRAYAYGRRAALATLPKTSIIGIAVDQSLAVSDSPARLLEAGELAGPRPVSNVCIISGNVTPVNTSTPLNASGSLVTAVEVGGEVHILCCQAHIDVYEQRLIAAEQANYAVVEADGGAGSSTVAGRPSSAWTHGVKKTLVILVDFSDLTGPPIDPYDPVANLTNVTVNPTYVSNRYNQANQVSDFFNQASYGQAQVQVGAAVSGVSPDITPVLRMPSTAASYATGGNNSLLHTDAEALAQAAGFNVNAYDRVGVVFSFLGNIPNSQITYGGLGEVTGQNFWINGYFNLSQVTHEMGHNFGLNHANLWAVTDGNPISPNGKSVEYGDDFDVMGSGELITNQYSTWNRSILQWIPDTAVTTVTTSGNYRVFTFDNAGANLTTALALKVVRDNVRDYWIGFRTSTNSTNLNNGAYVQWGYNINQQGDLLNLKTPGNTSTAPALEVGNTFTDAVAGVTLKTLDKGGSGAGAFLDLQITIQSRIQWSQLSYYADEQLGQATLTLVRNDNGVGAVSVHYATSDGTATAPGNYTAQSGNVSWANGDTSNKTITIPLVPGAFASGIKSFNVTLSSPSGSVIGGSATATVGIGAPGTADPSFAPFFINSTATRVIVQPDGKVLVFGWFSQLEDANATLYDQSGFARYNADGTPDVAFDSTGGIGGVSNPVVYLAARQPDGKIVIWGNFTTVNGQATNKLARLNTDGSLDPTFNVGTGPDDVVNALLVQPDGKVVIGGLFLNYNGTSHPYVARLNANGTLDASFGIPGISSFAQFGINAMALQPDGKILLGGTLYISGGANFKSGLCRVNANGTLDATFNGIVDGAAVNGSTNSLRSVTRMALQQDGNIVITGDFTAYNNTARGGIARVTSTGALDNTFAPTIVLAANCSINSLLVQPDGKILVGGGFTSVNNAVASNLTRLTSTGATDPLLPLASGPTQQIYDFAMQPDGKVVYAGDYGTFQGSNGPMWRFFSGLSGLPGTIQWSASTENVFAGGNLVLTATRTGGSAGAMSVNYALDAASAAATLVTPALGTLSWANGDSAAKTATIPIISSANGTLTVNLGAPLVGGALLGLTQQNLASITALNFANWLAVNFNSSQQANPLISGSSADPNENGLPNVLEYAFGLNPLVHGSAGPDGLSTMAIQNIGGQNYLTITFRERAPAGDVTYTPQTSAAAAGPWTANAVQVGSPVSNGDGTQTVTYRDSTPISAGSPLHFMRVDVTVAP